MSRRRSARLAALTTEEPKTPPVKIAILPLKKQPLREVEEAEAEIKPKPIVKVPVEKVEVEDIVTKPTEIPAVETIKHAETVSKPTHATNDYVEEKVIGKPIEESAEKLSEIQDQASTKEVPEIAEIQSVVQEPIGTLKKSSNIENLPPAIKGKKKPNCFKSERDRFKSVIKTKGLKTSFKQRMKFKEDQQRVKAYEQSLRDRVKKEKEELRARQEQNKKNREENQRKSEVVQQVHS